MASSKNTRWILWIGIPALVAGVAAAVAMSRKQERTFFSSKVEKGDVISIVQATGTINAVHSVLVGSQVSGNIEKLYADFNVKVKKGDVIARIEPSLFQAAVDQAKADLDNAVANEKSLEVQIEVAKADIANQKANIAKAKAMQQQSQLDLKRAVDLGKQGIVPQQQVDAAQATNDANVAGVSSAEAQLAQSEAKLKSQMAMVDQAKAQISQKKAALSASQVNLDHTVVYAPINGTVVARSVDVGQTVAAAMQAPTLFTIAEDLSKMQVDVATDESDVGNVKVGGDASFKVDAFPKDTFHGTIRQVRMNATTVQNVVTYDTVIDFDNPDFKLLPGMTAYITIPVSEARNVIKLPNGAVRFKPDIPDDERNGYLAKVGIDPKVGGGGKSRGMASGGPGGDKSGGQPGGGDAAPARGQAGGREAMGGGGSAEGKGRGGPGGPEGPGGPGGARGGPGGAAGADMPVKPARGAVEIHTIWKLVGDKQMEPVLVRTSITDYTYTAVVDVLKGTLNEGDTVITGMSIPNRGAQAAFGPGQPGRGGMGPMGGAGGGRGPGR